MKDDEFRPMTSVMEETEAMGEWPGVESQPTQETSFRFQCPQCGGKFRSWAHDNPATATSTEDTGKKRCPFCHVTAGEFGESNDLKEENERLREELAEAETQIEQLQEALEQVQEKF